jgi:WD40 repeat protein
MVKVATRISVALIVATTTISPVQSSGTESSSPPAVAQIAADITVRIDGQENGSGAIVAREGDTYQVLTNCHVVDTPGSYAIVTSDGEQHLINISRANCHREADLAVVQFSAKKDYLVAEIGDSAQLTTGTAIYIAGWVDRDPVNPERGYRFRNGAIAGIQPHARKGYAIVHTSESRPGMSGGPILDAQGRLIGINGQSFTDPNSNAVEFYGIPIDTYTSWQKIDSTPSTPVATLTPLPNDLPTEPISSTAPSPTPKPESEPESTPTPPPSNNNTQIAYVPSSNYALTYMLRGHAWPVVSVAFSPDGQKVVSSSWDDSIKIWNPKNGKLERTLELHSAGVNAIAFSPDGQKLASASEDKTIKVWNLTRNSLELTLTDHSDWVMSLAFSPDGQRLASGSKDNTIKIWNLATGTLEATLSGHSGAVQSVAFSPDGQRLASGSDDATVRIWNVSAGSLEQTLELHAQGVNGVAFSPDGQRLTSGSKDRTIKIWNISTGSLEQTLNGHADSVNGVAFSPNGQQLVSASEDKTIKIWNLSNGSVERTLEGHSKAVKSIAFSPDGQELASGGLDNTVAIWQAKPKTDDD